MYKPHPLFRRDEQLFDNVDHERLLEILNRDDVKIIEVDVSENSYFIECQFVRIVSEDGRHFYFYGNGEHAHKELWIADVWSFDEDTNAQFMGRDKFEPLDKEEALAEIQRQREYVLKNKAEEETTRSRSGRAKAYDYLANLIGDEDNLSNDMDDFFDEDFEDWDD